MNKFLLYKITNLINNKIYIGVQSFSNRKGTEYFGSGIRIKNAIKKYGIENFKKDILETFSSEIEAYNREREIVNVEFLKRKDIYNINLGGKGGWSATNKIKKYNFKSGKIIWNSKNRKYFNDGIKTYRLYENDPKILGLKRGRLKTDTNMLKTYNWYNDGKKTFWLKLTDPKTKNLTRGRILSINAIKSYKKSNIQTGIKRKQKTKTNYEQNLKYCSVCNACLPFEKRHTSTCSGKCAGVLRFKNRSLKINQ